MDEVSKTNTEVREAEVVSQATPVSAVAETPKKNGNGCWKWGCGCLAVGMVLFVIMIIGVVALGYSISKSPEFRKAVEESRQRQNMESGSYEEDGPPGVEGYPGVRGVAD